MEKEDVLADFRLDAPLTEEEVAFLELIEHDKDDIFIRALQSGEIDFKSKSDQRWLVQQLKKFDKKFISHISKLAKKLEKDLATLSLATGAWAFSLRLALVTFGIRHDDTLTSLNNYAECLMTLFLNKGCLYQVEALLKKALDLHTEILGEKHQYTLVSLNNYAMYLDHMGEFQKAEPLLKKALDLHTNKLGERHPGTLTILHNYASCLDELGRFQESEQWHEKVLELGIEVLGEEHPDTIKYFDFYAMCLIDLGQLTKAEPLSKKTMNLSMEILGEQHPDTLNYLNNYAYCLDVSGHLQKAEPLYKKALELGIEILGAKNPDSFTELDNYAVCLHGLGKLQEAEIYYKKALDLRTEILGEQHPDTLTSLNNYALFLKDSGFLQDAKRLYKKSLELYTKALGEKHPDTLTNLHNYAECLLSLGHFKDAARLYKKTLDLRTEALGEKHPDTLINLHSYANSLIDQGYFQDAEVLYKKCLGLCTEVLGEKHPDTFGVLGHYAYCLHNVGRIQEAMPRYKEALELSEEILGEKHPDTLSILDGYAECLVDAEIYYKKALDLRTEILGEQHPDTLTSLNNYALFLKDSGFLQDAKRLYKKSLELYTKALGEKHPDTLTNLHNYAECLLSLGHFKDAARLYKKTLDLRTEALGKKHPDTLTNLHSYADSLIKLGYLQDAEELYKKCLGLRTEVLGKKHPDTLETLGCYTSCLHYVGRIQEAMPRYKEALELSEEILGEKHPDTLSILDGYAECLVDLDMSQEAEPLFKKVLVLSKEILGEQHPDTIASLNSYAGCLVDLARSQEAESLYKQALEVSEKILGQTHPDTVTILNDYANCLDDLYRTEEAELLFKQVLDIRTQILGKRHPATLTSLENYAACRSQDVLETWIQLATQLVDSPLFTSEWPRLVCDVSEILAEYGIAGKCSTWSQHFQALSSAFVEVLDLQAPKQVEVIRTDFITYHARYLDLCIQQNRLDLIPSILAVIQGRKLSALLLDEMEQNPIAGDKFMQQFIALRTELRQLAIGLQARTGNKNRFETNQLQVETQIKIQQERLAEYEQKYDQFRDLRRQLQEKDADFAVVAPMLDITTERLQKGLQMGHAIALLVQKLVEVPPFILLITKDALQLIPLPEDNLKIAYQQTIGYQQTQKTRRGMRRIYYSTETSHDDIDNHEQSVTLDEIQETLTDFWQYWADALENVQTFHLVTQGNLHILPYDLGCPTHINLYTYPGLLFYYQTRHTLSSISPIKNKILGVKVYDAIDSFPIPLVNAEKALLEQLWVHTLQTLSDFNQSIQWFALHFACHGEMRYEDDPLSAYLLLNKSKDIDKQLDARKVLNSSLRPQVVFQSACVVGRVTEDIDGDPLGLVSTFFLRGARYIIAAVQEVDDFYMPLLVCLFYQTWQPDKITPHEALHEAKRRLQTGDWYSDTETLVRKTYQPVLINYLQYLVDEEDEYTMREEVVETWPTCYTLNTTQKDELEKYQSAFDEIQEDLMTDVDNHLLFITSVLNRLCNNKHCLPVTDLCAWVRGFGYI